MPAIALPDISPDTHTLLGKQLFNKTWEYLDLPNRTADQVDLMIHTAHASAFHWRQVGTPLNFARSEWQLARVYAVAGIATSAMRHALRSLELCEANGIKDFDLAFAWEAIARASALAGDSARLTDALNNARRFAHGIADPEDRAHFDKELATIAG